MKKITLLSIIIALCLFLVACNTGGGTTPSEESSTPPEETSSETPEESSDDPTGLTGTLKVAALESAYGANMWSEIVAAFNELNPGVEVELIVDKNLEDVISPGMKAGDYPDIVHLGVGREAALTETLIKEKALEDITDVLSKQIPEEDVTVSEKLIPGFTDTLTTNPYGDGKTYLAPMFYSPCGLFYNAGLLKDKGWTVPTTWDEMWELGDKAKAEGIALFTYPTTGYFDAFYFALLNTTGGPELFNKAMVYTEGIWESPEAIKAFDIVSKLATYTEPSTPANANGDNFLKNQQLILDNKALFMPNGTWITGEMASAPRADGFAWGFMALPDSGDGNGSYSYTFFEQAWIPAAAENKDLAKEFLAFLYSDKAAVIFAAERTDDSSPAMQPIAGVSDLLTGENELFYSIYDGGAKAAMGGFAATEPVEGVNIADTLFGTVDSIVNGSKTEDEWIKSVVEASDALRNALPK